MVRILFGIAILFSFASVVTAEESGSEIMDFWKCASPTNGFWGLNDSLADYGIEAGFSINNIYQINIHGGTSTHNRKGRHTGSYELEMLTDLQKLVGRDSGSIFLNLEGGWPDT